MVYDGYEPENHKILACVYDRTHNKKTATKKDFDDILVSLNVGLLF